MRMRTSCKNWLNGKIKRLPIVLLLGFFSLKVESNISAMDTDKSAVNSDNASTAATITATDISSQEKDQQLVRKVRQELVNDTGLSTSAKNIIIVARDEMLILRGTVKNQAEKKRVMEAAKRLAGSFKIEENLEIKL